MKNGAVVTDDGAVINIDNMPGWTEDTLAKW
jgi:hypothetical protein